MGNYVQSSRCDFCMAKKGGVSGLLCRLRHLSPLPLSRSWKRDPECVRLWDLKSCALCPAPFLRARKDHKRAKSRLPRKLTSFPGRSMEYVLGYSVPCITPFPHGDCIVISSGEHIFKYIPGNCARYFALSVAWGPGYR